MKNRINSFFSIFMFTLVGFNCYPMVLNKSYNVEEESANLRDAASRGSLEEVNELLRLGVALLDSTNEYGGTALHIAAFRGHTEICERLVQAGASLAAENNIGNTPLHNAVIKGNTNTSLALKRLGADVNAANAHGKTPLQIAEEAQNKPLHDALLSNNQLPGGNNSVSHFVDVAKAAAFILAPQLFLPAALKKQMEVKAPSPRQAPKVVVKPAVPFKRPSPAEVDAITKQKVNSNKIHKELVNAWQKSGDKTKYMKHIAEVYKLILSGTHNLNDRHLYGKSALMLCCSGDPFYIKVFPSQSNYYESEVNNECLDIALLLIKKGANVNVVDHYGMSALMYVVQNTAPKSIEVMKALLDKGANVQTLNVEGNSALFLTQLHGMPYGTVKTSSPLNVVKMKLLLDAGAHVNQGGCIGRNYDAVNPIALAMYPFYRALFDECFVDCRKLLIESGADLRLLADAKFADSIFTFIARDPFTYNDLVEAHRPRGATGFNDQASKEQHDYAMAQARGAQQRALILFKELLPLVNSMNHKNKFGFTALSYVCAWVPENIEAVQLLLSYGEDPLTVREDDFIRASPAVRALLEKANPHGVRATFGTADQIEAKREMLEQKKLEKERLALAQARAFQPSNGGGNNNQQNANRAANAAIGFGAAGGWDILANILDKM